MATITTQHCQQSYHAATFHDCAQQYVLCYQQIPSTELLVKTKKSTAAKLASSKS